VAFELKKLLAEAIQAGASDVHVVANMKPLLRINSRLQQAEEYPVLRPEAIEQLVKETAGEKRFATLVASRDVDFSLQLEGLRRFRVNAHVQRNSIGMVLHAIPASIPSLEDLSLPEVVRSLVNLRRGLVLVTGQTGDGKSTTLAALVETMNNKFQHHIITLEDPIEYDFHSKSCLIEQREVGRDVLSFAQGLRNALRQDPDVIMVGEMRDLETTSAAISAAETGHLVLSSLHTQSAPQTIERIIDIYPGNQQNLIRAVLGNTLEAVISQGLFDRVGGPGMVPAFGVMICTPAVRNCIREDRIHQIPNIIQTSRDDGMCTFEDSMMELFLNGLITREQMLSRSAQPEKMAMALRA
jgi:twitching motility protein PilT